MINKDIKDTQILIISSSRERIDIVNNQLSSLGYNNIVDEEYIILDNGDYSIVMEVPHEVVS